MSYLEGTKLNEIHLKKMEEHERKEASSDFAPVTLWPAMWPLPKEKLKEMKENE